MRSFLLIPLCVLVFGEHFCIATDSENDPPEISIPILDQDGGGDQINFRNERHLFRARQPIYTGVHYAWQNPIRTAPTLAPRRNRTTTTTENSFWGQDRDRDRDQFQPTERNYNRPTEEGNGGDNFRPTQGERNPYRPSQQPEQEPIQPWQRERETFWPGDRDRERPYRPPQNEPFMPNNREGQPYQPGGDPFRPIDREGDQYRPLQREPFRPPIREPFGPTDRDRERPFQPERGPYQPTERVPSRPDERERETYRPTEREREPFGPPGRDRNRNPFQPSERERDPYQPPQRGPSQWERDQSTQRPVPGAGKNPGSEYDRRTQQGSDNGQRNWGTPSFGNNQCPPGSRLAKDTNRCFELGSKGPCNENMAFYQDPDAEELGYCDCFQEFNRPLVYHRETDKCYFVFQQAYCPEREWLILDPKLNFHPMCDINRCFTWTQANAPNWDWRNNGAELDMRGPVALLNEAFCVELQWPCSRESRENEKITELLVARKNERSREDIVLKFDGPNLVCMREMSAEFPGSENGAFRLLSGSNSTNTSGLCKKGLYSKMRSEGQCEEKTLTYT